MDVTPEKKLELFNQFGNLIRDKAHSVSRNYGFDYDDAFSVGYVLFEEAIQNYIPSKSSFSTFLYHKLRGLPAVLYNENKDIKHCQSEGDFDDFSSNCFVIFKDSLELHLAISNELSESAKEMLNYIFDNPDLRHSRNTLRKYFRTLKWTFPKIDKAFYEIKKWWLSYSKEGVLV